MAKINKHDVERYLAAAQTHLRSALARFPSGRDMDSILDVDDFAMAERIDEMILTCGRLRDAAMLSVRDEEAAKEAMGEIERLIAQPAVKERLVALWKEMNRCRDGAD